MSRSASRALAGAAFCFALAGCVTVQTLDRQAALHPLPTDVVKCEKVARDTPFPAEMLVGKWEALCSSQELLWHSSGLTIRKLNCNVVRTEYEFVADGRFSAKEYINGDLKNTSSGRWEYVVNDAGIAELTMHGWQHPYWCVFWYDDNEAALAFRNSDVAIKWRREGLKSVYDGTWSWDCSYKRDACLNELWVTHHISLDQFSGHRREMHRSPEIMRRMAAASTDAPAANRRHPGSSGDPVYSILACEREGGNDFAYKFELELKGEKSLKSFRAVQREFREAIKEDYAESFAGARAASLYVEFPEYRQKGDRIEGRAVVLTINAVLLKYDPDTRTGVLAVQIGANQLEEARKYIRKNIETLARDKNIALVTGEIPPAAKFYLGREELKDGNILEIEFKTE